MERGKHDMLITPDISMVIQAIKGLSNLAMG